MDNLLIAGLGHMGNNYARNALALRDEFQFATIVGADTDPARCEKLKAAFPEMKIYHIHPNASFVAIKGDNIGTAPDMASIVKQHRINQFIGATQTDSHLSVLNNALSARDSNGHILVRSVLQEKPFGLFASNTIELDDAINTIRKNDIRFSLNSVLMFSDIWDVADDYLCRQYAWMPQDGVCIYGKDRTNDTRPAHEGVFGTEGTHALAILEGRGMLEQSLTTISSSLVQGDIGIDTDVPYECEALFARNQSIEMALNFDRNYREVRRLFWDKALDEYKVVTLTFDQDKKDHMHVASMTKGTVELDTSVDGTTKLANSMRAAFSPNSHLQPYTLDRTLELRDMLARLKNTKNVERAPSSPTIRQPKLINAL